jgi:hypothetical protein
MARPYGVVRPRSAKQIEQIAERTRSALGVGPTCRVSMVPILEYVLDEYLNDFVFHVAEDRALGGAEAVTDFFRPEITLTNSTYQALRKSQPRARMTAAHELGHLVLHSQRPVYYAFGNVTDPLIDPERQADLFAAAFLMPRAAVMKMKSIEQIMRTFGVSRDAACCRARRLRLKFVATKKERKPMARAP